MCIYYKERRVELTANQQKEISDGFALLSCGKLQLKVPRFMVDQYYSYCDSSTISFNKSLNAQTCSFFIKNINVENTS